MVGVKRRREGTPSNLNPNKFFKIILPHILDHKRLRVPETFANKYTHHLPTSATLTIRTGLSWKIELEKIENQLYFTDGWTKFMERNDIKYGYFLEFEYEGNNLFKVHIIDLSCTEIDYPIECDDEPAKQKIPRNRDHGAKVTEEEEEDVEQDIQSGGTILESNSKSLSFTITARKYSISSDNPYLHMPKNFTNEHMEGHLNNHYKSVTLLAGDGREWIIDCYYYQGIRLVGPKWKTFVENYNWNEGEAFSFVLVNKKSNSATFEVSKL